MNKLQTTIAQGRRRQLGSDSFYELQSTDRTITVDSSKIPSGGLTIKMPNFLDKMKDVTPVVVKVKIGTGLESED